MFRSVRQATVSQRRNWWPVAIGAWAFAAGLLIGWRLLAVAGHDHGAPTDTSVEVGFARDMTVHHAQAVQMADIIRARTTDERMRLLATDIVLTQQNQIGRFQAWLEEWEVRPTSLDPPMQWMGPGMQMNPDGQMPGMAANEDVAALSTLDVAAAEVTFLQLMITHHYAGVAMAESALALSEDEKVDRLADSIVSGQYAEIGAMGDMLRARGLEPPLPAPMPEMPGMHSDDSSGAHVHTS
jgi:uncharacterized protein (DUF305 family)